MRKEWFWFDEWLDAVINKIENKGYLIYQITTYIVSDE